ncbi:hypothetical protein IF1G_11347 [Cordyceps javanica]|uniref:Uncharacterized protein n=1 Tax=Cordyceps javanica TaxID=43265 RepID=A0A545VI71_9HYPO|nr:hypothetical protein IF1G_11347 [Cordyceps javanica]TQW01421.1 hypothetical protein IF2G_11055 [Cordyceps javanica]
MRVEAVARCGSTRFGLAINHATNNFFTKPTIAATRSQIEAILGASTILDATCHFQNSMKPLVQLRRHQEWSLELEYCTKRFDLVTRNMN